MDLSILPTKKIVNTYKRYSLPVAEPEPTDITRLQFFYIGTQPRYTEKLKEYFEFGYSAVSADSAIFTLKRLLNKQDAVTIPGMIIADGTMGINQLVTLHQFVNSHKILAGVPFIVEGSGLSKEAITQFKKHAFIDELLFLHEFTAPALERKLNFLRKMKEKRVMQPESCQVETSFPRYASARALLKRGLDLAISSVILAIMAPLMLMIALTVKLDTGGPVLYSTIRTGRGYRLFHLYKFNTVIQDIDKMKNGVSISKIGLFLRKTGLDELPQLLNVWLGDMSLVGYRALPLYEAEQLTTNSAADHFLAPAGITGWQAEKENKLAMPKDIQLATDADKSDLLYDIWLMAKKPSAVIQKTNV
ncbi:sugar transferase [Longitalea luteola]|uniref:sugar transferase n=1 Tax=Longitalea luteola TaxID=2812563 RepID=UPI001A958F8B|nr:sugar transferase [Longitalea luteola]